MMKIVESLSRLPFGTASEILNQLEADGFVIVPKVPTEKMIIVGCENNPTLWTEETDDGFAAIVANDVFVSMVRAANQ